MEMKIVIVSLILLLGMVQYTGKQRHYIPGYISTDNNSVYDMMFVGFPGYPIRPVETQKLFVPADTASSLWLREAIDPAVEFCAWYRSRRNSPTSNQVFSVLQCPLWINDKYSSMKTGYIKVRNFATSMDYIQHQPYILTTQTTSHHFIVPIFVRGPPV